MAKKAEEKVNWYDEIVGKKDKYYDIFLRNGSQDSCAIFVKMLRERDEKEGNI